MRLPFIYITLIAITSLLTGCASQRTPQESNPEKRHLVGGWSEYTNITDDELQLFTNTTKELIGVTYQPTKLSKQIVSGMNYRFLCTATPLTLNPTSYQAIIQIYRPANGNPPTVTNIERIE